MAEPIPTATEESEAYQEQCQDHAEQLWHGGSPFGVHSSTSDSELEFLHEGPKAFEREMSEQMEHTGLAHASWQCIFTFLFAAVFLSSSTSVKWRLI